jgi:AcrR family transcriptional regulator
VTNSKRPGPEVRKGEIIESAIEVFGKKGYHGATTAEIADEAGLSSRMVFFYFNNKKELFREVLKVCTNELMDALVRGMPPTDDIKTFFKMTTRNFIVFLKENRLKVKILLQSINVLEDPDIKHDLTKIMEDYHNFVFSFLEAAKEKGEIHADVIMETATLFILGLVFIISYAEFLDLAWFGEGDKYTFTIGDYFIDSITPRKK